MSTGWMAGQLALIGSRSMRVETHRYNPRPPGVIREGSATDVVLAFLRNHPRRFFCHYEILSATGRSKVAVDWALIYLKNQDLIECVPDSIRNSRYLRYRITATVKE